MLSDPPGPSDAVPAELAPLPRSGRLLLAAALSGATALMAQTVWVRALGRAVGTTTESLASVAAVFLGGLGAGALWGGRAAPSSRAPGAFAGRCLVLAALCVLVSPWLFPLLPEAHLWVLDVLGMEPGPSPWPALVVALPLLLVPTLLMGASFPLLLASVRAHALRVGRGTGSLYALNTLGAALGVVLSVAVLPALGERMTLSLAAVLGVTAGALLLFGRALEATAPVAEATSSAAAGLPRQTPPEPERSRVPFALGTALFLTGFVGLGVEVAAFRLLEPLTGPHVYGLALLLVPVLLGIALGGYVGGRLADGAALPGARLGLVLSAGGVLTAAALAAAGELPRMLLVAESLEQRLGALILGTFMVLLPPLVMLGAAFPLAVRTAALHGVVPARAAGDLTALNAVGAVLGSLGTGFLLLPAWGAAPTLVALAGLLLAAGALLCLTRPGGSRRAAAVVAALPLVALAVPSLRAELLHAAPSLPEVIAAVRVPAQVPGPDGRSFALSLPRRSDARLYAEWFSGRAAVRPPERGGGVVAPREGRLGSVALVEEPGGTVRLRVNGLAEARFAPGRPDAGSPTEVALGLLPSLVHASPRRGLVIGHGAGWTAEAMLATGLAALDVAELDETVLAAVEDWRGHPLAVRSDPRAHLWLTDGRLLLRRAQRGPVEGRYDVIASQPSHPWVPGAGHLFTRQAYAMARGALAEGGVFAQWLNLFEMSPDLLRSALATFRDAFPESWLFLFPREAVLLGFRDGPALDLARFEKLLTSDARVQAVAGPAGFHHPGDLWRRFTLDARGLEAFAPGRVTPLVDDDQPALEMGLAWRVLTSAEGSDLDSQLRAHFPPDLARAVPEKEARQRWTRQAIDALLAAGDRPLAEAWDAQFPWGASPEDRLVRARLARERERWVEAEELLRSVSEGEGATGDTVAGWIYYLAESLRMDPNLGSRFLERAVPVARRWPDDGHVRAAMARLLERSGHVPEALAEYVAALVAKNPPASPGVRGEFARLLLAVAPASEQAPADAPLASRGDDEHVLELLREEPLRLTDRSTLELWARLEQRVGDPARAAEAEARLQALDRDEGRAARDHAWAALVPRDGAGLPWAEHAAALDPKEPQAHELVGLTRLLRHARARAADDERGAARERAAALESLGTAWRVGGAEARRRARAYLTWFRIDPSELALAAPP